MNRAIPARRGVAVAVIILLLAAVQMLVVASVTGSRDDAEQTVQRLLTARARYAADGAGLILARQVRDGRTVPTAGTGITIGVAVATFVSAPATGTPGTVVVDVRVDQATRRLRIQIGYPDQ